MNIRERKPEDHSELLRMQGSLYPEADPAELNREIAEGAGHTGGVLLVAERSDTGLCGFVEVSVRSCAEGCWSGPVPYIEAWYVDSDCRRRGIGRQLLQAAEDWARRAGFTEIASDCRIDNHTSYHAHTSLGYQEVERIIAFRKTL